MPGQLEEVFAERERWWILIATFWIFFFQNTLKTPLYISILCKVRHSK